MAEKFQLKAILSAVDKLTPTLKGIQKVTRVTREHLRTIGGAVSAVADRVGLPLSLITGALGGASLVGLKTLADNYAQLGAGLDDQSKRTGIAVDRLQELNYIAQMSDVSVQSLQKAVSKLNIGLANARAGKDKDLAALFAQLKINPRDVGNAADLLPKLADAFQRNTSAVVRARMGNKLFGESYQELLPLLVDGSAALDDLVARYRKVAVPLSAADAAAAADYADATDDLRLSWQGFQSLIGARVLPLLTPVVQRMTEWTVANREWLAAGITDTLRDLSDYLADVDFRGLISGFGSALRSGAALVEMLGGAKTVLAGLGVLMLAGPVMSLIQLGVTLFGAAKAVAVFVAAAGPVGWILAGVGLAAIALIANWDRVRDWFTDFFGWIGERFAAFAGWVGDLVGAAGRLLGIGGDGQAPASGLARPSGGASSLLSAPGQRMDGVIKVEFQDAPPGMRIVETVNTPPFLVTNVGYRSLSGVKQ